MYGIDNYPKNYHASGIGLVNLAALGYSKNEVSGGSEGGAPKPKAGLYPSLPYPSSESVGGMPYVVKQTSHAQNASYSGPGMGMGMPVPGAPSAPSPYPSATPYPGGGLYPSLPSAGSSLPYPTAPMAPYPTGMP